MRKKGLLKRGIAAFVVGTVTASVLAGALSASNSINPDEATASVAVFENLLNERSFVIDTFTKDSMPASNPYGTLDSVGNTNYLSTDFLERYETNEVLKTGVNLYYRMNHEGETISEIPSALLDIFASDSDWTTFCSGAKSKNYDSLLTSIYKNDYKSVSGQSVGNDEASMQTLRSYREQLDNKKDLAELLKDYLGALVDTGNIAKYQKILKNLQLYEKNMKNYMLNVQNVLLKAEKNNLDDKKRKDFSDIYEAQLYADYNPKDLPADWEKRYNAMKYAKYGGKIVEIVDTVKTVVGAGETTIDNIIMIENLYRNQQSMHDTLVRVRERATKNNDKTFIRASSSYLSMLESDKLGENAILKAGLKSIYNYGRDELGDYLWDTAEGLARDEAAIMMAKKTGTDTLSSKMAISSAVGKANAILAVGEYIINYGTGFDDVCEKIYLMKYLQEIKKYAVDSYNEDKNNYNKYKSLNDMKNMDVWASAAIDDLQFLKRIVLLQNELGYNTAKAQIGSKFGEILSWIGGCDDEAGLKTRYTNLQNALVDTMVNPISTTPFSINNKCTLKVIHSTDGTFQTYALYTNADGEKCTIAEFDNVMLGGIRVNGGTLNISDQSADAINMNGLFVTGNGGKLSITGNGGEIYAGRCDMNGDIQIDEKCSKILNVVSNCNFGNYVNIANVDIHVAGNCNVNGCLAFGGSNLSVDGNMTVDNGYMCMKNASDKLLVKGNLTLGSAYGSNYDSAILEGGTIEVKGDFINLEKNNYNYNYYETGSHKTVFSGDATQKISFADPGANNSFNENLEFQNTDINFATPIYDVKINQDTTLIHTENLIVKGTLNTGGYKFKTTGNIDAENLKLKGAGVEIEGNVTARYVETSGTDNVIKKNLKTNGCVGFEQGALEIAGDAEIDNGYVRMKNDSDKLLVKGNLTLGSAYGSNYSSAILEGGTIEIKGDFINSEKNNYNYNYYETGSHKTVFSGDATQKISFADPGANNSFNENLELQNTDINFVTPIYSLIVNKDMTISGTKDLQINTDLVINEGRFATEGNVHAKNIEIKNTKTNQIKGNLETNGCVGFEQGALEIAGDAEIDNGYVRMRNNSDKLLVKGNLTLGSAYGSNYDSAILEGGTIEVKGDFINSEKNNYNYNYYETGSHKTVFSGDATQKISFADPGANNSFNENLELQNTDINFATPIYNLTLNQDTVLIHTDLLKVNNTLNLQGHNLTTTGKTECNSVTENGGALVENPEFGHNYYKQLKPADLKEYDIKYADEAWVCTSCGKIFTDAEGTTEYDPDPCKDGHTIVIDKGREATCTTDGLTEGKHCSVCKTVLVAQEKIPAGHDWETEYTIDKEPSCTTEGSKSIHCKKCKDTKDEQAIPATGHKFGEWETVEETSCTKEGITQRRCTICSFAETKILDKKAHDWETEYAVDQPATFDADGSKSIHCKNCDAISEAVAIPRVDSMKLSMTTYTYSGGVKTPSVRVKDANGNSLDVNQDYVVKYASGRKNVGTYKVIVTLNDNYSGQKALLFKINPKSTSISSLSKARKAFTAKWRKRSPQVSGYQLMYSRNSKFKTRNKSLAVTSYKTTSKTVKNLVAKKKYYVKIRTYKTVAGKKYYSKWSASKAVVTK